MSGWGGARGTRHERGYGSQWDKLRLRILSRDQYLCIPCYKLGRVTPATEVDHITPKSQDGEDDADNLQSICSDCHKAKTKQEANAGRGLRAKPAFDARGFPVWE